MSKHNIAIVTKAAKLLSRLKEKARKNPKVFCENYGNKEIASFCVSDAYCTASEQDRAAAQRILWQIYDFSPYQK